MRDIPLWVEDEDDDDPTKSVWLEGDSLAPYLGTPAESLDAVLSTARIDSTDVLVDLGCGDGRLPIWAVARFGARRGVGVELDEDLAAKAVKHAQSRGVADRVRIIHADIETNDKLVRAALADATVLALFLLPEGIARLEPHLVRHLEADHQNRILCIGWAPPNLEPAKIVPLGPSSGAGLDVFLFDRSSLRTSEQ
ncbi:hypothetical protein CTAYLR_007809 [Chrysophaeum taylorii]|uniref:Methyltransferase domain-containing protein n=1 Tax=Chrysophaeum taylorii TaxID=2483200 RepID=A0AAD7XN89_9STRA|nr:hypothetical protein CTAYLR_007809 [Chrysophaeum taylorii]